MALNKFMHPRNHYKNNRPDFAKLGEKYSEFARFLQFSERGKPSLDFKDPEALRALTCTLLKEDFDLDLDVPLDHLIPTVPLRLNYIHWLEDLIKNAPNAEITWGIDIGCGTSCIYPLLGAKMNGWHFWALEVDPLALQYARDNVDRNHLGGQIKVIENPSGTLFSDMVEASPGRRFYFTMCNPPFFGNLLEAQGLLSSRGAERPEPSSVSTADEGEMIVEGGEVEFVRRMIEESRTVKDRVLWFTSMLGKKSSVGQIVAEFKREKIPAWTTTEFCQGKTMRWGVAWSYQREAKKKLSPLTKRGKDKPPLSIPIPSAFITEMFQKLIPATDRKGNQPTGRQEKVLVVAMAMEQLMKKLKMSVTKQASTKWNPKYSLVASTNTWSHQRRKRRQAKRNAKDQKVTIRTTESAIGDEAHPSIQKTGNQKTTTSNMKSEDAENTCLGASGNCTLPCSSTGVAGVTESAALGRSHTNCGLQGSLDDTGNPTGKCEAAASQSGSSLCCQEGESVVKLVTSTRCTHFTRGCSDYCMGSEHSSNHRLQLCDSRKRTPHVESTSSSMPLIDEGSQPERDLSQSTLSFENAEAVDINANEGTRIDDEGQKQSLSFRKRINDDKVTTCNHGTSDLSSVEPEKKIRRLPKESPTSKKDDNPRSDLDSMKLSDGDRLTNDGVARTIRAEGLTEEKEEVGMSSGSSTMMERVTERGEGEVSSGSWGRPTKHIHSVLCMSSSDPGSGSDAERPGPLLECVLEVKLVTKGGVEALFTCEPGQSRVVLHQVVQYVKNYIAKEVKGT